MLFSMEERFASSRGSRRAVAAAPNQLAGSKASVMLALPAPTTKLPSLFCEACSDEVKVKAWPSMVPSTITDAFCSAAPGNTSKRNSW